MVNETLICQSCAMPMFNEEDFGIEVDGSKSEKYCQFCYTKGKFVLPSLTLEQQIERLTKIAVEKMGMSEDEARNMAKEVLPKLERWK